MKRKTVFTKIEASVDNKVLYAAMYGPPPISKKKKYSCMTILLLLGALVGGIIAWLTPKLLQPCVYGPPPIEEPCVYGPPPFEEQERDSDVYGPLLIEEPKPKPDPKPKSTLYGPRPIGRHNKEEYPLY